MATGGYAIGTQIATIEDCVNYRHLLGVQGIRPIFKLFEWPGFIQVFRQVPQMFANSGAGC
jgi:hypothetical protein